jgi:hypothetical protein
MTTRHRVLLAAFGVVSTSLAAACSGGGGGGGGSGTVPTPVSSALGVTSRPLASGQSFSYAGTTTDTFVFSGATPEPQSTTVATVAQAVTVTGPTSYGSSSNAYDVHTVETDTSPLQAIGTTTDTFDSLVANGATTDLETSGFTSTATSGETLAVVLPATGAGLLDELPERAGASWTNGAAEAVNETSPGGVGSTRNVNADGSYTDTTTFPTGSIYASPVPGAVLVTSGVITQHPDGSGSYVFNGTETAGGAPQDVGELDFATPAPASSGHPATIAITVPQPAGSPAIVTTIPVWYPQPLTLYAESDSNRGAVAIPSACGVSATIGTSANAVVTTIVSYDTIVGTQENFTQTQYVVPAYGLACVSLNEKLAYFYDYSGQTDLSNLVPNANVTATATYPIETETIATTLGLAQTNVAPASFARVMGARSNFIARVERAKLRRRTALAQLFHRVALQRTVR